MVGPKYRSLQPTVLAVLVYSVNYDVYRGSIPKAVLFGILAAVSFMTVHTD
jgi:hypothetical protein